MKCLKCQHENGPDFNFCNNCGTRLSKKEAIITDIATNDSKLQSISGSNKWMIALGVALVLLLTVGFVNQFQKESTKNDAIEDTPKSMSEYLTTEQMDKLASNLCEPLNAALKRNLDLKQYLADAKANTPSAKKATKDYWSAASWKKKNPSWFVGYSYSTQLDANINETIALNLGAELKSVVKKADYQAFLNNFPEWSGAMKGPVISACELTGTVNKLRAYDDLLDQILNLASNKPWYPKGFEEIAGYPGFAWGDTNGYCTYSFGSCAIFKIVSKTACPSNLYVEANGLISDVVVDWGNDTARVAAGQVARMEISFSNDIDKWQFTKIDCY